MENPNSVGTDTDATKNTLASIERRLAAAESELVRVRRRLHTTWLLAFVGSVGICVLGLNPEARAQFGVTLTSLNNRLTIVEAKTQFVSVASGEMYITGTNLHIQNGLGATNGNPSDPRATASDATQVNGKGNLIIGYNAPAIFSTPDVTGSHNLILGDFNTCSSFGSIVSGRDNTVSAPYAATIAGRSNAANAVFSSVLGGAFNICDAAGNTTVVVGGDANTATNIDSVVCGGNGNTASGRFSTVGGGNGRSATGDFDWVAGGIFQDF